eukprot:scaffold3334_cov56-Phaeocystis_antarctica.AAC.3
MPLDELHLGFHADLGSHTRLEPRTSTEHTHSATHTLESRLGQALRALVERRQGSWRRSLSRDWPRFEPGTHRYADRLIPCSPRALSGRAAPPSSRPTRHLTLSSSPNPNPYHYPNPYPNPNPGEQAYEASNP